MTSSSPFHEGEQRIHTRLGIRDEIEPWARRVVRSSMPDAHRDFFTRLPFLVLAARDAAGRPWATLLSEEPGFVSSPDPRNMRIAALPSPGDALADALQRGDEVGLLGIELDTRRRNRVNGRVAARRDGRFDLAVDQSFGNCPQYITERHWRRAATGERAAVAERGSSLSRRSRELVRRADTFFIATGFRGDGENAVFGMDASHRGGAAGFVQVRGPRELVFPDYAGNNHFNTLGNLVMDPRGGLLFVDFERGDLLQLTGRARIDWDSPEIERTPGAHRLVHYEIAEWIYLEGALPLRWEAAAGSLRELELIDKRPESADVSSFVLAARDGGALPGFAAGQYLPIELEIPGQADPALRTYSLSGSPEGPLYRISVKREPQGLASRYLHDEFGVGQRLAAAAPRGSFTLDGASERSAVLLGAGVGVTPLVSMLHQLVAHRESRPAWFVYAARDGDHHPLRQEVEGLVAAANGHLHVAYSRPGPDDSLGQAYHSAGRIDGGLLERLLPDLDADFYVCGPRGFMAAIDAQLEERGVPPDRIRSESFGPAT